MKIKVFILVLYCLFFIVHDSLAQSLLAQSQKEPKICETIRSDYVKQFDQSSGHCVTNAECACFGAGIIPNPCGGVTDRYTAKEVNKTLKLFKDNNCQTAALCEPWSCQPVCKNGFCTK